MDTQPSKLPIAKGTPKPALSRNHCDGQKDRDPHGDIAPNWQDDQPLSPPPKSPDRKDRGQKTKNNAGRHGHVQKVVAENSKPGHRFADQHAEPIFVMGHDVTQHAGQQTDQKGQGPIFVS